MPPSAATVLLVESEPATRRGLEEVLRRSGLDVRVAGDGALAMSAALADPPQLVVSATEMPLLGGFKLSQLLRANPVTREIPFVFLTSNETTAADLGRHLRPIDEYLRKPVSEPEFLARVGAILTRGRTAPPGVDPDQKLLGTLTEIGLTDLLQVLRMNRRSGLLEVDSEGRHATLYLSDGEIVEAEAGRFRGEKALYRTLAREGGRFEFRPQALDIPPAIVRRGENLILEALRQVDEVRRIRATLAPPGTRLRLVRRFAGPPERLRPVTREILRLLEYFTGLDDILDQSPLLDLDLCAALQTLVDRGIVAVASVGGQRASQTAAQPLLSLEDALKLGYRLGVGREENSRAWSGKVLLAADERELLRAFLESLSPLKEIRVDAAVLLERHGLTRPLGPVGTVQVLEGTELVLYALPGDQAFRPLWEALANDAVGGIALTRSIPPLPPFARTCAEVLRLPFLVAGPGLRGQGPGAIPDWTPAEPWAIVGYGERDEAGPVDAFRTFFGLVLQR